MVHRCRLAAQGLVTERVTLVHVGAGGGHGDHVFGGQSDELLLKVDEDWRAMEEYAGR